MKGRRRKYSRASRLWTMLLLRGLGLMRGLLILLILLLLPQWSSKRITMRRAHDSLTTEAAQEVLNIPASSHDYGSLT